MVVTIDVQKKSVNESQKDLWSITLTLIVADGATELINKDFSINYRTGQSVSHINQEFVTLMQEEINKYKREQFLYNHTQLTNSINNIKTNLTY